MECPAIRPQGDGQSQPNGRNYGVETKLSRLRQGDWNKGRSVHYTRLRQNRRMTNQVKPFTPQELEQLADRTLEHYREHAEDFREGTRDHDVSQNIAALLQHIAGPAPFT